MHEKLTEELAESTPKIGITDAHLGSYRHMHTALLYEPSHSSRSYLDARSGECHVQVAERSRIGSVHKFEQQSTVTYTQGSD